jgi:MATE family multidrug resistance protein
LSPSNFSTESKKTLRLAGPIIVGQVGQNLISLADTVMVGSLGATALGASAFAGSIYVIFLLFGVGVLAPLAAMFARIQGQEDHPQGGVLLRHSLLIAFAVSFILISFLLLMEPHLAMFGQTPEVLAKGSSFFKIIVWSILPSLIYQAYKQFGDGIGRTKISMNVMLIGVVLNIGLNYLLIHGYYGFPRLGLNGSAIATLIARSFMALLLMVIIHLSPSLKKYFSIPWSHRFDKQLLRDVIRLGVPNGLTHFFEVGAFATAAVLMGWFGTVPLAAHQITISLASTSFMITVGIGIASSIRVGFEIGRGDYRLARYAGFTAIQLGIIYMSFCALGFFILRGWLPTLYVNDVDVIDWAAKFFVIVAIFQIFDGTQAVAVGALRGLHDTQWPSIIAFISYWIIGLPGGFVLGFYAGFGPIGIWIGLLAGLICAAILLTLRFHLLSRRLDL